MLCIHPTSLLPQVLQTAAKKLKKLKAKGEGGESPVGKKRKREESGASEGQ